MSSKRTVNKGDIYMHFKNKLYQAVGVAFHSETGEKYIVYQALYGNFQTYIRPYDMFLSEVDHEKYPDVKQKYRFEKVVLDENGKILWRESDSDSFSDGHGDSNIIEAEPAYSGASDDRNGSEGVNPYLIEFLDRESSKERIEYINSIKNKVDNRLISDIAAALDLTIEDGDTDDRFRQLINCLQTIARFECNRLR